MQGKLFWLVLVVLIILRFYSLEGIYTEGNTYTVSGVILSDPSRNSKFQFVKLGNIKVIVPAEPIVGYGDSITASGIYKDNQIYAQNFEVVSSNFFLFDLRSKILSFFQRNIPEPHSSLVAGMVLGAKRQIEPDFMSRLRLTGTSHIVVASGMNVVMIAFFFLEIFKLIFNRKRALLASIISIWLYILVAGFEAPLIRAGIMSSATIGAQLMGRPVSIVRVLLITGGIMLVFNPFWLWDVGFQLSFLATISLVVFESKVNTKLSFVPKIIKSDLSTTLAAQIGVTPVLLFNFGQVSLIGPLVNTLILWTVPLVSIGGMIAGLMAVVLPELGRLLLILLYPLTWWFTKVIYFFS